jgi:hypothetical protein
MVLKDMHLPEDEVCYIGCVKGSNFFWIGQRKNIPEKFLLEEVIDTYHRYTDYPGTVILLDGLPKRFFGGKAKNVPGYWYWYECDPSVTRTKPPLLGSERCFENLLVSMARDEARYYKARLNDAIIESAKYKDCMDREEADEMVKQVREMCKTNLILLPGSNVGDYTLLQLEDEARAKAMYPRSKWVRLKYQKQLEYLDRMTKIFRQERYKQNEREHYASIKGRSVHHE